MPDNEEVVAEKINLFKMYLLSKSLLCYSEDIGEGSLGDKEVMHKSKYILNYISRQKSKFSLMYLVHISGMWQL